jgi:glycosyltransferase involved in cell wall biosynthesis
VQVNRVVILLISDGIGGAEQVVWQTIHGLSKYESIYLAVNNEIASFYADLLPNSRILNIGDIFLHTRKKLRIIRFFINNRYYSLIPLMIRLKSGRIANYLIRNEISIIHSHLDYALYSSLQVKRILKEIKIFHTVHGAFGLVEDKLLKPSLPLSSFDFKIINKLIFVSQYNYNLYKEKSIPVNDYKIIYNGIDLHSEASYSREIRAIKEFEILYVGGSKYVKGYDILVETIVLLRRSFPENPFHVVVLGHLTDHCDFVSMTKQRGIEQYFRLIGYVTPPLHLAYFKSANVLFMPSRSEALPIAAIEAISLDLPVIASNTGGLPEIIKHGKNGMLGNNNPRVYIDLILDLFAGYNTFLEKTRDYNHKTKHQFDANYMCQELLEIYGLNLKTH